MNALQLKESLLNPEKVNLLIKKSFTRFAFVIFYKRDGSLRKMLIHGHIPRKMIKGVGAPYDPIEKRITFVHEISKDGGGIKALRWDSIITLSLLGRKYKRKEYAKTRTK